MESLLTNTKRRPIIAFIAIVIMLGANFVAARFSNLELPPLWGAGLRFVAGTVVLGVMMLARRVRLPVGSAFAGAVTYGLLNFGVSYGLMYWALLAIPSGQAAVIFSTLPLVTLLLAVMVGLERIRLRNIVGALVTLVGIGVIFHDKLSAQVPLLPQLAVLGAVIAGATASIVVKRAPRVQPLALNAVGMTSGSVLLLGASFLARESHRLPTLPATWFALGWLTMTAVAAFILFVWLLGRWTASATSYVLVLAPLVTIPLAGLLSNESLRLTFAIGSAVVILGAYVGTVPMSQAPPSPPDDTASEVHG